MISKSKKKIENKKEKSYYCTDFYILSILVIFPLYIHNLYFDIVNAKFFFFAITSFVYAIFLLFDYLAECTKESMKSRLSYSEMGILFFLLWNLISYFVNGCVEDGLWGWESRRMGVIPIAFLCIIYMMIRRAYRFRISHVYGFVLSCSIIYVLAILQNLGFDPFYFRADVAEDMQSMFVSTIGNTNFFGSFLCLSYSFFVVFFCICKKRNNKAIGAILILLGASAIVASDNNGVLVAIVVPIIFTFVLVLQGKVSVSAMIHSITISIVGFLFMFFMRAIFGSNEPVDSIVTYLEAHWHIVLGGLIPLLVLSYLSCKYKWNVKIDYEKRQIVNKQVKENIQENKELFLLIGLSIICSVGIAVIVVISQKYGWLNDTFGNNRGFIWNCLGQEYQSFNFIHKLIGVGPETVQTLFMTHYEKEMNQIFGGVINAAHNEYLNYLITSGLLGLISYIFFLIASIKEGMKNSNNNWCRYAFLAGAITYLLNAIVNIAQPLTTPLLFIFLAIVSSNCDSDLIDEV